MNSNPENLPAFPRFFAEINPPDRIPLVLRFDGLDEGQGEWIRSNTPTSMPFAYYKRECIDNGGLKEITAEQAAELLTRQQSNREGL